MIAASHDAGSLPAAPPSKAPWLANYPSEVPHTIGEARTLMVDAFRATADEWSGKPAYGYMGREITYGELLARVETLAAGLVDRGVVPGDRVLVCLPNMPAAPLTILAAWFVGAAAVPINPLLSAKEHAAIAHDSDPKIAVVLDALVPRFAPLVGSAALAACLVARVGDDMPWSTALAGRLARALPHTPVGRSARTPMVRDILSHRKAPARVHAADRRDLAAILYTGGTTGDPKGVELTHGNVATHANQVAAWFHGFPDGDIGILGVFPFFSAAGMTALMAQALLRGACVELVPRPTPESIVTALRRRRIDVLPAVPTIYQGLLDSPAFERWLRGAPAVPSICVSGAAPLPRTVFDLWHARTGQFIRELFGMTETTAMISGAPVSGPVVPGSVGMPLPDTYVKIVSDAGEDVGPTVVGEVLVSGPQVTRGYRHRPDATRAVLANGWLRTGDLGTLDESGNLFIVGRKKEMIISSGYNVYPSQVELAMAGCPGVAEVACVGIADRYRGESLAAFVVPLSGRSLDLDAVKEHCRKNVAAYAVPRELHVVEALPRNALGKVRKDLLARGAGPEGAPGAVAATGAAGGPVRAAAPADIEGIRTLLADCSLKDSGIFSRSARDIARHIDSFLVLAEGDRVGACVCLHDHGWRDSEIRSLAVDPALRGRGHSVELLDSAARLARARGFGRIWLDTDKPALYSDKLGFRAIPRVRMARIVPSKLVQVFKQPPSRWLRALTGQFTPMELRLGCEDDKRGSNGTGR